VARRRSSRRQAGPRREALYTVSLYVYAYTVSLYPLHGVPLRLRVHGVPVSFTRCPSTCIPATAALGPPRHRTCILPQDTRRPPWPCWRWPDIRIRPGRRRSTGTLHAAAREQHEADAPWRGPYKKSDGRGGATETARAGPRSAMAAGHGPAPPWPRVLKSRVAPPWQWDPPWPRWSMAAVEHGRGGAWPRWSMAAVEHGRGSATRTAGVARPGAEPSPALGPGGLAGAPPGTGPQVRAPARDGGTGMSRIRDWSRD
jgi:hypothetical protein